MKWCLLRGVNLGKSWAAKEAKCFKSNEVICSKGKNELKGELPWVVKWCKSEG